MKTFILRARKGSTRAEKLRSNVGSPYHSEVIAHSLMNAFFVSNGFRSDVDCYLVLDSSEDFPRTLHLASSAGLSFPGFHEAGILEVIEQALHASSTLQKDAKRLVAPGVTVYGFGFDKLVAQLLENRPVYLLSPKGQPIHSAPLEENPVFILSDHIPLPPKIVKSLKRRGVESISLGKQMLFASQCIVLIHYELDR